MYAKLALLSTVGFASEVEANPKQQVVTLAVTRNPQPFKSGVSLTSGAPVVEGTQFGAYGHYRPSMVLDLDETETWLLEKSCKICVAGQHTFKPTYLGKLTGADLKTWEYTFADGTAVKTSMEQWQDQTCLSKLCLWDYKFYSLAQTYDNKMDVDGVIGLAAAAGTFPQNMGNSIVGNEVFTLSYDAHGDDHIFTLGGIDGAYVAADAETAWAAAVGAPRWGVTITDGTFGPTSFTVGETAYITNSDWHFELPLPAFDEVTNYYISQHPYFKRNDDQTIYAKQPCPDSEDLVLNLGATTSGKTISINVTSDDYAHYEDGTCTILFRPSENGEISFGDALLEKYVVSFDAVGCQIGFTERAYGNCSSSSVAALLKDQI